MISSNNFNIYIDGRLDRYVQPICGQLTIDLYGETFIAIIRDTEIVIEQETSFFEDMDPNQQQIYFRSKLGYMQSVLESIHALRSSIFRFDRDVGGYFDIGKQRLVDIIEHPGDEFIGPVFPLNSRLISLYSRSGVAKPPIDADDKTDQMMNSSFQFIPSPIDLNTHLRATLFYQTNVVQCIISQYGTYVYSVDLPLLLESVGQISIDTIINNISLDYLDIIALSPSISRRDNTHLYLDALNTAWLQEGGCFTSLYLPISRSLKKSGKF